MSIEKQVTECTLTDEQLVYKVDKWVVSLCDTVGKAWSLSVPARPNEDPDLLIVELIRRFREKNKQDEAVTLNSMPKDFETFHKK